MQLVEVEVDRGTIIHIHILVRRGKTVAMREAIHLFGEEMMEQEHFHHTVGMKVVQQVIMVTAATLPVVAAAQVNLA